MSYTTLARIKAYLNIPESTTDDDDMLTAYSASAQVLIDTFCGRTFEAAEDTTNYFAAHDERRLSFGSLDLCQITSVVNGDGTLLTAYTTEPRNGPRWYGLTLKYESGAVWTSLSDDIAITGRWAYSVTADAMIAHATQRLTAWLYRQKDSTADLDRHIVSPDGIPLAPSRLPNDVTAMLSPYRRRV
jgi:hypothetical protein